MAEDGSEDRSLYTHVTSMFDGTVCMDAVELAGVYGGPVFEPTWWPLTVEAVHYVVPAQPPAPIPEQPPGYRVFATVASTVQPPVVIGSGEPPSMMQAGSGWRTLDELDGVEGHVREFAGSVHVVLRLGDQTVQLGFLTSLGDALEMARSLRRVDPPS